MSGKAILVIGARGTGKTFTNRKLMEKVHPGARLILDVNGEYKDLFPHDPIEFSEFAKKSTQVKNAVILIEEATVFLSNRGWNGDITSLLVKARHNNNTIIFTFHSFRAIPKYIFDLCNVMVIHKTGDNIDIVKEFNHDGLLQAFNEIQNAPWIDPPNGKRYSPQKTVILY